MLSPLPTDLNSHHNLPKKQNIKMVIFQFLVIVINPRMANFIHQYTTINLSLTTIAHYFLNLL